MRWILILISALLFTACGSSNTNLDLGEAPQLAVQASPIVEYNVLIRYTPFGNTCNKGIQGTFGSSTNYLKTAALSSTYKKVHNEYCLITLSTSNSNAPTHLNNFKSGEHFLEFSENVLYSLDGSGSASFDPTCDQIEAMDLDADDVNQVDNTIFEDEVTINNAYVYPGSGVSIAIVGTGTGGDDKFQCNLSTGNFYDHDNHIESIIQELAPSATIKAYVACDGAGVCPSNEVGNQLLTIWAEGNPRQIVNLSLGGHVPDFTHEYIIGEIMKTRALVVASAGNGGSSITEHYPASFASTTNNMLSVAALGTDKYTTEWAPFNTDGVANIAAPGMNLCPTTADGFRCGNDIGISGTSFAAPYVAGVAAVYMDRWSWNVNGYWNAQTYRNRILNRAESVSGFKVDRVIYK